LIVALNERLQVQAGVLKGLKAARPRACTVNAPAGSSTAASLAAICETCTGRASGRPVGMRIGASPRTDLSGHSGTTPDSRLRPAGTGRRPDYARFLTTKVTNVRRVVGGVLVTSQQPSAGDRWWDEPRL
jgi:hypothetical protein